MGRVAYRNSVGVKCGGVEVEALARNDRIHGGRFAVRPENIVITVFRRAARRFLPPPSFLASTGRHFSLAVYGGVLCPRLRV